MKPTETTAGNAMLTADRQTAFADASSTELLYLLQAPLAMAVFRNPGLVCSLANDAYLTLFGKTHKDVVGQSLFENLPELRSILAPALQKAQETTQPISITEAELLLQRHGRETRRYFDIQLKPLRGPEGPSGHVLIVLHDVTKAKEEKRALEQQNRLYETVMENTPDLVYVFDMDYKFVYANKALLTMWGRTWHEAVGRNLLENGYEPWHAEMHEREIDRVVASKEPIRGEVSFVHAKQGKRIYDYIFSPVLNENGTVEAIAGTTRDITEIKAAEQASRQNEQQLRSLANSMPQIVWTTDAKGYHEFYNQRWYEFTGLSFAETKGAGWAKMLHPDDLQRTQAIWQHSLQTGAYYEVAYRMRRADGEYRWLLVRATPFRNEEGTIERWFGTCTDIHDQKHTEEKLEGLIAERTRELQRSNDDLQQFAHVASHDLKEPVRKIRTFGDRLKNEFEDTLPERAKLYITKIEAAAARMHTMIDGVLHYSMVSTAEQATEQVDLAEIIHHIEGDLEVLFQQKGATIQCRDLPVIEGSGILIYQLFYNLVNNALKFSRPDVAPVIHVDATAISGTAARREWGLPAEMDYVQVQVQDNGIGFLQEQAERIFKTFTRLNARDKYEGTGLGLALCKKIVERHHGHIAATGMEGMGAVFTIILPVQQPHYEE